MDAVDLRFRRLRGLVRNSRRSTDRLSYALFATPIGPRGLRRRRDLDAAGPPLLSVDGPGIGAEMTAPLQTATPPSSSPELKVGRSLRRSGRTAGVPLVVWVQDLMRPASAQSGISGGNRIARATTVLEAAGVLHAREELSAEASLGRLTEVVLVAAARG